ncbi:MAG: hypothetical protein KKF27_21305 [Gammaproteobacteria bacterium]|nr:hypothetical protein [Gammaproteobacteria bacterium]
MSSDAITYTISDDNGTWRPSDICPCCHGSGQATKQQVRHFALTWLRRHPYAETASYQQRIIANQALGGEVHEDDCRN